ncbi:biliverdin reductase A isoform X3 [Lampetra planeri]
MTLAPRTGQARHKIFTLLDLSHGKSLERSTEYGRSRWRMPCPAQRFRQSSSARRIRGKVLHVEHIELLTSQYKMLKQQVAGREPQEGHLDFTGKPLCEKKSGFLAFSGVTRVTWFVDLFGELSVEKAMLETCPEQQNTKLTAHLLTANNKRLTWVEERGEGLMRSKQMRISFTDGSCMESLPQGPGGSEFLFMQDLSLFARKLRAGAPFPDSEHAERRRILHCLQLATDIQRHCMQLA